MRIGHLHQMPLTVLEVLSGLRGNEVRGMSAKYRHLSIQADGRMTVAGDVQVGQPLRLDSDERAIIRQNGQRQQ